jgi:hypothetical protein
VSLATPHAVFLVMGLLLAVSALIDLRRPGVPRNWPFRGVMLTTALGIAASPYAAAGSPEIAAVVSVVLAVAALITFPRSGPRPS